MSAAAADADDVDGMNVTTAPGPERGRAGARLQTHLDALARLDPVRPSAAERLENALGVELAQKLVFALAGSGDSRCWVTAAA
jgi:hypothetical protein